MQSQDKLLPPKLEKQTSGCRKSRQEQKPIAETFKLSVSQEKKKPWTVIGESLEPQCGQLWELQTPGGQSNGAGVGHTFLSFTSSLLQGPQW